MIAVSVVIPAYNCGRFIRAAVDSVLDQTFESLEIIVVDDGSTDDTKRVLSEYADRVRYVFQENKGRSAARNRGIRESKGAYVAFLDADDIWEPEKLELQMEHFASHPEVTLVYSDAIAFAGDKHERQSMFQHRKPHSGACSLPLLKENFIPTQSVVIKKEDPGSALRFDEDLEVCEDYELWLRLSRDYKFGFVDQVLVQYRIHDDNVSRDLYRMFDAHMKIKRDFCRSFPLSFVERRRLFGHVYHKFAYNLFDALDFKGARRFFLRSVLQNPCRARSYAYLIASFLPQRMIRPYRTSKFEE